MPKKTLYISDADMEVWEKAESMADSESLSKLVTKALRVYVFSKEQGGPYERIELATIAVFTADNQLDGHKTVAFHGQYLVRENDYFVYETAKQKILIYYPIDNWFYTYEVYDSFEEALKATKKINGKKVPKFSSALLADAAKKLHGQDWVEELDI